MNPMIVLKLLDLAALGFAAWERYDERKRQGGAAMADIDNLRRRILAGTVTDDEASAEIDRIAGGIISARKQAIGRLPTYPVSELDD
jgi:predicted membrane chloride channel (bestrophin family)